MRSVSSMFPALIRWVSSRFLMPTVVCASMVLLCCSAVTFLNSLYPSLSLSGSIAEISNRFKFTPKSTANSFDSLCWIKSLTSMIFRSSCNTGMPLSEGAFVMKPFVDLMTASFTCFSKSFNSKLINRFNLMKER